MASGKCEYLSVQIANFILGKGPFEPADTLYVALSLAAFDFYATGDAMNEVWGDGYARFAVANNLDEWPNQDPKVNAYAVTYPAAITDWGQAQAFYLVDAASGGNCYYGGDLSTPRDIRAGDTPTFPPNGLQILER